MSLINKDLYDALRSADVAEEKASKAAESVAAYDNRLTKIEGRLELHSWMLGALLAMSTAILVRIFTH